MSAVNKITRRSLPHNTSLKSVGSAAGDLSLFNARHFRRGSSPVLELNERVEYEGPFPLMRTISTVPHEGLSARNETWVEVQNAIIKVFKRQELENAGNVTMQVRKLMQSDVGRMVFDYFRKNLVKRGMTCLRRTEIEPDDLESKDTESLLWSVTKLFSVFSKDVIFTLKMILHPLGVTNQSMDQALWLGFRDHILFTVDPLQFLKETSAEERERISPAIKQMFLVLQMYRESEPPTERDLRLEKMVSLVVKPYIGYLGVYDGTDIPIHKSTADESWITARREKPKRTFISKSSLFRSGDKGSIIENTPIIMVSQQQSDEEGDAHPLSESSQDTIIYV